MDAGSQLVGSWSVNASTGALTISGLTDGVTYTLGVTAANALGYGQETRSNAITPADTLPGAPTNVRASAYDSTANVFWDAPAPNGGSAITSYTVTSSGGQSVTNSITGNCGCNATVGGLTNGTAYTFTVVATNGAGNGSASAPSNSVTPTAPPTAPTNVTATPGNAQATVSWTPPSNNGGSAITGYVVQWNQGASSASAGASSTSTRITGLTNGVAYAFTVAASNAAGSGSASAPSPSVTPATVPDTPAAPNPTAGDRQVTLTWNPPNNGGSPITQYIVRPYANRVGQPQISTNSAGTTYTVTSLTNGAEYTFTVAAQNGVGVGPPSPLSITVVPGGAAGPQGSCFDHWFPSDGLNSRDERYICQSGLNTVGYSSNAYTGESASLASSRSANDAVFFVTGHSLEDFSQNPHVGWGLYFENPNKDALGPLGSYSCSVLVVVPQPQKTDSRCAGQVISQAQWASGNTPVRGTELAVLEACGTYAPSNNPNILSFGVSLERSGHVGHVVGFKDDINFGVDGAGQNDGPAYYWATYFWMDVQAGLSYDTAAKDGVQQVRNQYGGNANGYDSVFVYNHPGDSLTLTPPRYYGG